MLYLKESLIKHSDRKTEKNQEKRDLRTDNKRKVGEKTKLADQAVFNTSSMKYRTIVHLVNHTDLKTTLSYIPFLRENSTGNPMKLQKI